ncbi:thioredoxin-like protein [Staphylotrichum tortipilum]|uniref:Thioredoxin-like protein n=1 Tax=Staphylotrichum tortipilum TaxID=2831512 RepID=A0AAN6MQK0_9PEZI|nr:thioredoxin-like protein [Staphylotrichum longicolle]
MASFTFHIELYSDPICSFCCLGKTVLDRAIARYTTAHPDVDFRLTWLPYMLWPDALISGYDKAGALVAVYGRQAPAMVSHITALGRQFGVPFNWSGRTGNSRDAHKLILLAAHLDNTATRPLPSGRLPPYNQTYLHRTLTHLFASTFQSGRDISSREFLVQAALTLGLLASADSVVNYLNGAHITRFVDESSRLARQRGVQGVPTMLVQGNFIVGGVQPEHVLLRLFETARQEAALGGAMGLGWALADRRFLRAPPLLNAEEGSADSEARAAEVGIVEEEEAVGAEAQQGEGEVV